MRSSTLFSLALFACGVASCGEPVAPVLSPQRPPLANDTWISLPEASAAPSAPTPPPGEAEQGHDFIEEARMLFRVAACSGDAELPATLDTRIVDAHCAELSPKMAGYKKRYVGVVAPFLASLVPKDGPSKVVYPFSGGDLVTALTAYPNATAYTTLSLELAGDPRRIRSMNRQELEQSLVKLRAELDELIAVDDYSRSETLKRTQRGDIPGELAFFLVGLALQGYEPTSLRYFEVQIDGSLHYLTQADIDAVEHRLAEHKKGTWIAPDFSEAFANTEIVFKKIGAPAGEEKVHRHIAVNLADAELRAAPGVLRYLEKQGDFFALTKAASYLLWNDSFSVIRDELLGHAVFMVSDSTGIPPFFASRAGFVQDTYGSFRSSLLHAPYKHNAAFKKLWETNPKKPLPFRFGYRDAGGQNHLLVTRKSAPKKENPTL